MSEGPQYQLGMFNKHVGDTIQLKHEAESFAFQLVEAVGRLEQHDDDSQNFSLLFNAPDWSAESHLPQSSYQLEHDALGALTLFLVPVGVGGDGRTGIDYEAVFSAPL